MNKLRVGVIRGGVSDEYPISLKTGASVLSHLPDHYKPIDILIDREGVWHASGVPQKPEDIFAHIDVIFNALHGYYGEDGKIQHLFESFNIPHTGSGSLASAMSMNKVMAKHVFLKEGLKTPRYAVIEKSDDVEKEILVLYRKFPQPSVVKPLSGGSSFGVAITYNFNDFSSAIKQVLRRADSVLIEEYKKGVEATCGVIDDFRGEKHYALPPVEIIPSPQHSFFDHEAKYSGASQELCPSPNFSTEIKDEIMNMALRAHRALGLRHYSRADFIVSPQGIYLLEINTLPGLTEESLLPKSVNAVGCSFPDFLDHLIILALEKK